MRVSTPMLLAVSATCMAVALTCQNITLVGGNYRGILTVALGCMAISDGCCAAVFRRGGSARWAALPVSVPSVFIFIDFLRRFPGG